MFMKHAIAMTFCSALTLPGHAIAAETGVKAPDQPCLIAGWENPPSVCIAHNRTLTATCFNCHGPNGVSATAIPGLAGQDKDYIISAMKAFRSGERESTVMQKYAKGYTDSEYEGIAAHFATMKLNFAIAQGEQK